MMMMERKIAQCHFFNGFQVKGGYGQFLSTFFTDVKETSKVCSQQEQQQQQRPPPVSRNEQ